MFVTAARGAVGDELLAGAFADHSSRRTQPLGDGEIELALDNTKGLQEFPQALVLNPELNPGHGG